MDFENENYSFNQQQSKNPNGQGKGSYMMIYHHQPYVRIKSVVIKTFRCLAT